MIAADRFNPTGYYLRGSILQEQGKADEAASSWKQALYLEPGFVVAHFALGNLARTRSKFVEADRHFANAFALAQKYPPRNPCQEPTDLRLAG